LKSIPGLELIEMGRSRQNSFCCGGGAGRIWTEEATPENRPSVNRTKEALELGVDLIVTACPFCVTTLEDAVKVLDVENKLAVRDISDPFCVTTLEDAVKVLDVENKLAVRDISELFREAI